MKEPGAVDGGESSGLRRGLVLRDVTALDRPLIRRIYGSTRAEELAPVPWSESQKEAFLDMQFLAQDTHYSQQFPRAQHSIIEFEGREIGRLYVDRSGPEIKIIDIALLPEGRNRGIGSELLRAILAEAATAGKAVLIHVEQFNPALRLYERLGFRQAGLEGVHFRMEWRAEEQA